MLSPFKPFGDDGAEASRNLAMGHYVLKVRSAAAGGAFSAYIPIAIGYAERVAKHLRDMSYEVGIKTWDGRTAELHVKW